MQDRYRRIDEILLRRTAGPYIWVKSGKARNEHLLSAYDHSGRGTGSQLSATSRCGIIRP
jgi:hypothetical protein